MLGEIVLLLGQVHRGITIILEVFWLLHDVQLFSYRSWLTSFLGGLLDILEFKDGCLDIELVIAIDSLSLNSSTLLFI